MTRLDPQVRRVALVVVLGAVMTTIDTLGGVLLLLCSAMALRGVGVGLAVNPAQTAAFNTSTSSRSWTRAPSSTSSSAWAGRWGRQ